MGDTTREEYEEYVTDCSYYGFDVDYDKGENYYRAYNEDGYYLSLSYEGNNIMLIRIDEPQKGAEAAAGTENVTEETAKDYIEERAIGIAGYIIDHNATVRQTAKAFGISKSTVHVVVTI